MRTTTPTWTRTTTATIDGGAFWNGGDGWRPIGASNARFTATFEGNNHTIANLFISRNPDSDGSSWSRVGLFGRIGDDGTPPMGATIRNLALTGASVTADDEVGILAGQTYSATSISNVRVSGSVTGDENVGGLIGRTSDETTISGSSASGSVTGARDDVGGLVGLNKGDITASYSSAAVSARNQVGGLAGASEGDILASYATGSVNGSGSNVGGLVGDNDSGGSITASYSTGAVSALGQLTWAAWLENSHPARWAAATGTRSRSDRRRRRPARA